MLLGETTVRLEPEQILERVWDDHNIKNYPEMPPEPLGSWFIIDESFISLIAARTDLTPEEMCAAIECWRVKMNKMVDEVAQRYTADATQMRVRMETGAANV